MLCILIIIKSSSNRGSALKQMWAFKDRACDLLITHILFSSELKICWMNKKLILKHHIFKIYLFLIGRSLLYNVVLVSAIHHHESAIGIHRYPLLLAAPSHLPPHPTPLGHHRAPNWAPCIIQQILTGCLFLHVVYMFQRYSLNLSHLLPPLCPHVYPLHLCLYSCLANRFISTIFLDSINMH